MILEGQVATIDKASANGSIQAIRMGRSNEIAVMQARAVNYDAVKRGRVFIGSNAITGAAIPIYSGKVNTISLWNPSGSGVDLVLLKTHLGIYSTNAVLGSLIYTYLTGAGTAVATGACFSVFTAVTPVNAYLAGGFASKALFSPATNTSTNTAAVLRPVGISWAAITVATTANVFNMVDNVDGNIIIPPDTCIQLYGSTAVAMVANISFTWEEVPI
jgi:hypothetical protein